MPKRVLLSMLMVIASAAGLAQDDFDDNPEDAAQPPILPEDGSLGRAQDDARETTSSAADDDEPTGAPKALIGMSILGNEEAPKSLVIVPWKSSEIGDGLGVSSSVDARARPVDRDVFLREIRYYELRSRSSE